MNVLPSALLYSREPHLIERVRGALATVAHVLAATSVPELDLLLAQHDPVLVLADLRDGAGGRHVLELVRKWSRSVFVVLGDWHTEPAQLAQQAGVFGIIPLDPDPWRLQAIVGQGLENLRLRNEVEQLRSALSEHSPPAQPIPEPGPTASRTAAPLWHLTLAMRNIEDVDALFTRTVEGISAAMLLSRVGVFARSREDGYYRLCAGTGCLEETRRAVYSPDDPLVRWMTRHSHLISAAVLPHVPDPNDRRRLQRALDLMGAEAISPFFARGRLYGWLFVGRRATGTPFSYADLEELSVLAGHVATIIDNAHLYEEATRQRILAETLLCSLPWGILAVGEHGVIQWCNTEASRLLERPVEELLGQPVESANSRIADALRRALIGEERTGEEWTDPVTGRSFSLTTRRFMATQGLCLGAVALIEDRTAARRMARRMEEVERAAFWAELAAAMSHEVRNPLTAIKAFAQLLPERYAEPEFREEFKRVVTKEIERLEQILEAIRAFAHPSAPKWERVNPSTLLDEAVVRARQRVQASDAKIELRVAPDAPSFLGDPAALSEAFAHLVVNALEHANPTAKLHILITAERIPHPEGDRILFTVRDNGRGIPEEVRLRLFSPFGTTKARGFGLGLPIARRVMRDHGGELRIDSNGQGTLVSVILPVSRPGEEPPGPTETPRASF